MKSVHTNSANRPLSHAMQLREAVLRILCDPSPSQYPRLLYLSHREWRHLLNWLDTSGLALYFLDRLSEMDLLELLPQPVLDRLRQNLTDNSERIEAMIAESVAIQRGFQQEGLSYAVLKGFSLWPLSVPKLELRSQLDLDFLVPEESANDARKILENAGYRLHAVSGRTWEFKANEGRTTSLKQLYKAGMSRSAELHLESSNTSLLSRAQQLFFYGVCMPVLSPVDLFVGQGLHLYKHVCSEFSRTAHLIEFRRHVIARYRDDAFWSELRQRLAVEPETSIRLGACILLISRVMGPFAPEALTRWTVDLLPPSASLWIALYGRSTVLASFPGSKLYLLLQKELEEAGLPAKRSLPRALLPRRLPPPIAHAVAGETLLARMTRYCRQLRFVMFRLRFHALEGIRYFRESMLWRRLRNEPSQ